MNQKAVSRPPSTRTKGLAIAISGALALASLPVACGEVVVSPVAPARDHVRPGAAEGPWGRCQFDTDSPQRDDGPTVCPDPGADHEGDWTCIPATESLRYDNGYVYCEAWGTCIYSCTDVSDCPAPPGGTAALACWGGQCQLTCADTSECPDGMACADGRCLWHYADYCDNGPISPADPCAGKATCAPCSVCSGCGDPAFCNADGDCELGDPASCESP